MKATIIMYMYTHNNYVHTYNYAITQQAQTQCLLQSIHTLYECFIRVTQISHMHLHTK